MHRFELCGPAYTQLFYSTENMTCDFLNNILFSLVYFIVRIQYVIHRPYKICVNLLAMLS